MKFIRTLIITASLIGALATMSAYAQTPAGGPPTPGFNNKLPEAILTHAPLPTEQGSTGRHMEGAAAGEGLVNEP